MGSPDFRPISLVRRVLMAQSILCDQVFRNFVLTRYVTEGDFTIVVSAFSPTHLGEFSLLVSSSRWIEVDPIPQEGAGMFAKTMRGEWCVPPHYVLVVLFGGRMTDPVLIMQGK
jgi:hypothetical protein